MSRAGSATTLARAAGFATRPNAQEGAKSGTGTGTGSAARSMRAGAVASRQIVLPLVLGVLALVLWEYLTRWGHVPLRLLPPPSAIWATLLASLPVLLQQAVPTLRETLIGFGLAAVFGMVLGALLSQWRRLRQTIYPHVLLLQLIPKVALAPLFIVWMGIGPSSRLCFVVFMAFFPVVVSVMAGLLSPEQNVLRLCAAINATPLQTFLSVRVPYAMPHLFAGLKVSVTMAMIGVVVGEFVTAQAGLGYMVMFASSIDETPLVFAAITLLCVIGLTLYGAVALLEWLVQRRLGVRITSGEF